MIYLCNSYIIFPTRARLSLRVSHSCVNCSELFKLSGLYLILADKIGIQFAAQACFDPRGAVEYVLSPSFLDGINEKKSGLECKHA